MFPAVHGTYCEDGTLQGLLELAMVPYVGADSLGSAIGMDKDVAKRLLRDAGIPVVPWVTVIREEWDRERGRNTAGGSESTRPSAVCQAGADRIIGRREKSQGLTAELADAIDFAFQYDTRS